jgi:hypothetical protein
VQAQGAPQFVEDRNPRLSLTHQLPCSNNVFGISNKHPKDTQQPLVRPRTAYQPSTPPLLPSHSLQQVSRRPVPNGHNRYTCSRPCPCHREIFRSRPVEQNLSRVFLPFSNQTSVTAFAHAHFLDSASPCPQDQDVQLGQVYVSPPSRLTRACATLALFVCLLRGRVLTGAG